MADNVPVTPGSGATIATDDIGGVHYQIVKVAHGAADSATQVSASSPLPVAPSRPSAAARTSVAAAAADTQLLAANTSRFGATVHNDSSADLYLALGPTAASTASFTVKLAAGGYYEVPYGYTGPVRGIWSSAAGNARITELT